MRSTARLYSMLLVLVLLGATALTAQDAMTFSEEEDHLHDLKAPMSGETLDIVEFETGHQLIFVALPSTDGQRTVGVAEVVPEGDIPFVSGFQLEEATPHELFLAFTREERPVPRDLAEIYPVEAAKQENRGWALDELAVTEFGLAFADGRLDAMEVEKANIACSNNWFNNWIPDHLYPHDRYDLNQKSVGPLWQNYCAVGNGVCCSFASRKRYQHRRDNADRWTSHVCGRSTGSHNWFCTSASGEAEAYLTFLYRDSNNNGWNNAFSTYYPNDGSVRAYYWYWSGSNYDWQVAVLNAVANQDEWDIYVGWEN
ncbi:hypothetical protein SCOR_10960 [Sulfidibacter corallicola]|uniref:Uncharacterized protein n=1 Tax=Sulfidibacter corallicola TaxID=2818388 RepID=A0A8A4TG12_SULCO|nr:hypothetical protein [Sulfidibacter corallicola]QTD48144.1 hypothetical protein J3U87_21370 [Sulfidibacter corallicola]